MKKISSRFSLNKHDLIRWGKDAIIFAGPAFIVLIGSAIQVLPADWKYSAIVLWILNQTLALLKKFLAGPVK